MVATLDAKSSLDLAFAAASENPASPHPPTAIKTLVLVRNFAFTSETEAKGVKSPMESEFKDEDGAKAVKT